MVAPNRPLDCYGSSLIVPSMMTQEKCPKGPQHQEIKALDQSLWRIHCGFENNELPQWNPQDDTNFPVKVIFTAKKRKSNLMSLIAFAVIAAGGFSYHNLATSLRDILIQSDTALEIRNKAQIKLRSAQKDVRMLSREIQSARELQEAGKPKEWLRANQESKIARQDLDFANHQLERIESVLADTNVLINSLQNQVKSHSRHIASEKYGTGTHRVRVVLEFPDSSQGPDSFTVEMASLASMPHSVQTFLDMASNGLWDGCSFVMNAMHVLKAAPLPFTENGPTAAELTRAFGDAGLNGPTFNEQNDLYSHKPYTLGFAGGKSPSFYINTDDNTKIHQNESAFGRITDGFETIDRLSNYPTHNGIWFRERIGIKSLRVL